MTAHDWQPVLELDLDYEYVCSKCKAEMNGLRPYYFDWREWVQSDCLEDPTLEIVRSVLDT
jgi:hypothetical protein